MDEKTCWICFCTSNEDPDASWVKPCKCRGSTKWVHQSCLQRWIYERTVATGLLRSSCNMCRTPYVTIHPPLGWFTSSVQKLHLFVSRPGPALYVVLSVYIVTYPFYFWDSEQATSSIDTAIERNEPINYDEIRLPTGLFLIPVNILCRYLFKWEDKLALILARASVRNDGINVDHMQYVDREDGTSRIVRIDVTTFVLPLMSKVFGNWMFKNYVDSPAGKTLLGIVTLLSIGSVVSVFYEYNSLCCYNRLQVLDHPDNAN